MTLVSAAPLLWLTTALVAREVGYIRTDSPDVDVRPWQGVRYIRDVPDTLDLAERAELAINCLTRNPDPAADYEIHWVVDLARQPPSMMHDWQFVTIQPKFMEALPLLRLASGSTMNWEVDQTWARVAFQMIGPDGLVYTPTDGRPWANINTWGPYPIPAGAHQFAIPYQCGRMMGVYAAYYLRDRDPVWAETIENLVDRLEELSVDRGTWAYFPHKTWVPGDHVSADDPMPAGYPVTISGWVMLGLCQAYRATGYASAIELAGKLAHFIVEHGEVYESTGRFRPEVGGEFHHRTYPLLAIADYASLADDPEIRAFVLRCYEWARDAEGQTNQLVGFIPMGYSPGTAATQTEGCGIADMVGLATKLSAEGIGDFWDDVDRWTRNQFAEAQFCDTGWLANIPSESRHSNPIGDNQTDDAVANRNIGAFAGWAGANEFTMAYSFMHCCTGNGARTIYYVWRNILDESDGQLRVNLLLNRAAASVDLDSRLPYEGRVDLHMKQKAAVQVRIPAWVSIDDVIVTVNDVPRPISFDGRYALIGEVDAGATATIFVPLEESSVRTTIGGAEYTLTLRGADVVDIDPEGTVAPLYQRDAYRSGKTAWVTRERFVGDQTVTW